MNIKHRFARVVARAPPVCLPPPPPPRPYDIPANVAGRRQGADHAERRSKRRSASSPRTHSKAAVRPRAATHWRGCTSPAELAVAGLSSPAARTAAGSRPSTWSAPPRSCRHLWSFTGKNGKIDLKLSEDYIAGSGVQTPSAAIKDAGLVFVGYGIEAPEYKWDDFKGVDVQGQGARHAQQRSGLGSEVVRRQDAPVLRPLDLQVRKRRASWRGGRHHRAHHAVGRLSVAGGAVVVGRRAVRAARRRRAAHPAQGLGHRRCRAPPGEGRRAGSRQADRRREEPHLQAGAARAAHLDQVREQGLARAHRERGGRAAGQRSEAQGRGGRSTRRTTITSASASRTRPATRSTTAPRTMPPAARRCWPSRAPWRRCPSGRAARCSCCSSPARSRGC